MHIMWPHCWQRIWSNEGTWSPALLNATYLPAHWAQSAPTQYWHCCHQNILFLIWCYIVKSELDTFKGSKPIVHWWMYRISRLQNSALQHPKADWHYLSLFVIRRVSRIGDIYPLLVDWISTIWWFRPYHIFSVRILSWQNVSVIISSYDDHHMIT